MIVETRMPDEFLELFPTARSARGCATRWGRSERYRSGTRVTGGLVWPLPAPSGGFAALGGRPADLDRSGEALAERGRWRSDPAPGSIEPPPPRRSAIRVRVCMPRQNAGTTGHSSPGRHVPTAQAARVAARPGAAWTGGMGGSAGRHGRHGRMGAWARGTGGSAGMSGRAAWSHWPMRANLGRHVIE